MGPGDPFATRPAAPDVVSTDEEQVPSERAKPNGGDASASRPERRSQEAPEDDLRRVMSGAGPFVLVGLLMGALFGAVILLKGALAALVLGFFAGLGGLVGLALWAVTSDRTDVRGALNTFLRRPPR